MKYLVEKSQELLDPFARLVFAFLVGSFVAPRQHSVKLTLFISSSQIPGRIASYTAG
jgi:hypothetical protein